MTVPFPLRHRSPAERRAYLDAHRQELIDRGVPAEIVDAVTEATAPAATELRVVAAQAVTFQPGQRVLIVLDDGSVISPELAGQMSGQLAARFPGVEFTIVAGVSQVAVMASDK